MVHTPPFYQGNLRGSSGAPWIYGISAVFVVLVGLWVVLVMRTVQLVSCRSFEQSLIRLRIRSTARQRWSRSGVRRVPRPRFPEVPTDPRFGTIPAFFPLASSLLPFAAGQGQVKRPSTPYHAPYALSASLGLLVSLRREPRFHNLPHEHSRLESSTTPGAAA